MTFYEYGQQNDKHLVLIHPSLVFWDYFEYIIPLLETEYHLIIPALPGYDKNTGGDFSSIEEIASQIEEWLLQRGYQTIDGLYGCSMGGAVVIKLLANHAIHFEHAIIDGGITPYQLPWLVTRLIAVKDFLLISIGKIGGVKLLEKAFATDELSEENIQYEADLLRFISYKTIWRTFESCNNYKMPKKVKTTCPSIRYWYAEKEIKERKLDIRYVKKQFPQTKFERIPDVGHGGLAIFQPEVFARKLRAILQK